MRGRGRDVRDGMEREYKNGGCRKERLFLPAPILFGGGVL